MSTISFECRLIEDHASESPSSLEAQELESVATSVPPLPQGEETLPSTDILAQSLEGLWREVRRLADQAHAAQDFAAGRFDSIVKSCFGQASDSASPSPSEGPQFPVPLHLCPVNEDVGWQIEILDGRPPWELLQQSA